MKILALGATGAIGREMVTHLAAGSNDIHVTTRIARTSTGTIRYRRGDAKDESFLHTLLDEDWDAIVDFMVYDTAAFRRRVDALLGAAKQYVFISSARVFAQTDGLITESSPRLLDTVRDAAFLASDEYALTKARQEDVLRNSGKTNWTIVRPYITFGNGRLQLGSMEKEGWLYRALQGRSIVFCGPMLDKWTTLTDGTDVARMLAALVGHPDALGEDFNLTDRHAVTWREVLALYLDVFEAHLGRRPAVAPVDLETFCNTARTSASIRYDRMCDRRFDTSKIDTVFDTGQLAAPLSGLRRRLNAQLSQGSFLAHDWPMEALRDKIAGERASLGEISSPKARLAYLLCRYLPFEATQMLRLK